MLAGNRLLSLQQQPWYRSVETLPARHRSGSTGRVLAFPPSYVVFGIDSHHPMPSFSDMSTAFFRFPQDEFFPNFFKLEVELAEKGD